MCIVLVMEASPERVLAGIRPYRCSRFTRFVEFPIGTPVAGPADNRFGVDVHFQMEIRTERAGEIVIQAAGDEQRALGIIALLEHVVLGSARIEFAFGRECSILPAGRAIRVTAAVAVAPFLLRGQRGRNAPFGCTE